MEKLKVIFIPGNGGGSVTEGWFPWLKRKLEEKNISVIAKDFPDPVLARKEFWLPFLHNELKADKDTILVGYSSGAVAAMRYAENNKLLGSVLIGACYTDLGDDMEKKSGYYDRPWNWKSIKENQDWIIQFASKDDPFIPIQEARYIHQHLNSNYYEYDNRSHFNAEVNKEEFPELLDLLLEKINSPQAL